MNARLTDEQMNDALGTFTQVTEQVLERLVDDDMRTEVVKWLDALTLYNVHFIFRPDIKDQLDDVVLANETVRNFLFDVQFRFYALAGTGPGFVNALCSNLDAGLRLGGYNTELNALPSELAGSLPTAFFKGSTKGQGFWATLRALVAVNREVSLHDFLYNNPVYVTVLMLYLTVQRSPSLSQGETA